MGCWQFHSLWHRSQSTLAHVMACCLMAPSHYLNQFKLIISKVQWHSSEGNFARDAPAINHWNKFENSYFVQNLPGTNELTLGMLWDLVGYPECYCPASRTTLVATRFRVAVICPIIQVPHCIRVFFYFVWFVFINHIFQFYYELCTYCNILDIYLS